MAQKKVIILGASRYNIISIQTAKRLGYHVIVVDKNRNSPGFGFADEAEAIDILDHKTILALSLKKKIDGIAAVNDYGVFTAAFVSDRMTLKGIGIDVAEAAVNKEFMRLKWAEKKQPNPRFRIVRSLADCLDAVKEIGCPCIIKPSLSGGGSRGVVFVDDVKRAPSYYEYAMRFNMSPSVLVEEYLCGVEHSAEVLVFNGKGYFLAVSDKIKTPLPYRVDKNVLYPTVYTGEQRKKLEKTVVNATEALGIQNGCAHVECCTLPSGEIKLFELSARPGGGGTADPIVAYLTGVNEFEQYLKICVGDEPDQFAPLYERGCNYHFILPPPGRIKSVDGAERIPKAPGVLDFEFFRKPGDLVPEVKMGPDRSGFIIIGADSQDDAYRLGQSAESLLKITYEDVDSY